MAFSLQNISNLQNVGVRTEIPYRVESMFSQGEQGVFYDSSDISTMFQDAAGTTPVTAVEQSVGLMLDKRKGLALGPELVTTNSHTDTVTGSDFTGGWSGAFSQGTLSSTKWYKLEFDYVVSSGGKLNVGVDDVSGGIAEPIRTNLTSTSLTHVTSVFKGIDFNYLFFYPNYNAGVSFNYTISNISVREIAGNHAYQTTSASRPLLSARYNLLTKTEDFSDAVWSTFGATRTYNAITSPIGSITGCLLTESGANERHIFGMTNKVVVAANVNYTILRWVKVKDRRYAQIAALASSTDTASVIVDLQNGVITDTRQTGNVSYISSTCTKVGYDWYAVTLTIKTTASDGFYINVGISNVATFAAGTLVFGMISYQGDGTSGIYIWGASLVLADQASLPYQRVNTSTDYDTVGFKPYLKFDGIDDFLVTNSIDFTATDKMTVWAGVRKLSDAGAASIPIVELSADYTVNNGSFAVFGPQLAVAPSNTGYGYRSKGTVTSSVNNTTVLAPSTNVLACISSISEDICKLRINGTEVVSSTADQGTGNYGNYPLYIGRRGGWTSPFNGQIYSLIIRGAQSTDAQIIATEKWVNNKTGAYNL